MINLKQMYVEEEKKSHHSEVNGNNHHKSMDVTNKHHEHTKHSQHHQQQNHHEEPISNQYNVDLHFDSIVPEAGRKTMMNIRTIRNSCQGIRTGS